MALDQVPNDGETDAGTFRLDPEGRPILNEEIEDGRQLLLELDK